MRSIEQVRRLGSNLWQILTRLLALFAIAGVIDLRYLDAISGLVIRRCFRHMSSVVRQVCIIISSAGHRTVRLNDVLVLSDTIL